MLLIDWGLLEECTTTPSLWDSIWDPGIVNLESTSVHLGVQYSIE